MLDNGFPLATESNILKEMIKPPNILRTIANTVTGRSKYVFGIFCSSFYFNLTILYTLSLKSCNKIRGVHYDKQFYCTGNNDCK